MIRREEETLDSVRVAPETAVAVPATALAAAPACATATPASGAAPAADTATAEAESEAASRHAGPGAAEHPVAAAPAARGTDGGAAYAGTRTDHDDP